MGTWVSLRGLIRSLFLVIFVLIESCVASTRFFGQIYPGLQGSQMNWIDNDGIFLLSNKSKFGFGFTRTRDVTLFLLVVKHMDSKAVVWTANRGSPIRNSDQFVYDKNGNAYLESAGAKIWSTDTANEGGSALELLDSGNLILVGKNGEPLWESFSHPTDTLLVGQNFSNGMKLISEPNVNNLSFYLEIVTGDLILYAGFSTPQPYWSMGKERRKISENVGEVYSASIVSNSWRSFDRSQHLLSQFIFSDNTDANVTWAAVLGNDGMISFMILVSGGGSAVQKIPQDSCSTPEPCGSYSICNGDGRCQCPAVLSALPNCKPGVSSGCRGTKNNPMQLISVGDKLSYFALEYVSPVSKSDLSSCKNSCMNNCSCLALFFDNSSRNCFLFDDIGSLRQPNQGSDQYSSYVKVLSNGNQGRDSGGQGSNDGGGKHFPIVVIIVIVTLILVAGLGYVGYYFLKKKRRSTEPPGESSEEENFLGALTGMPIRFSYKELEEATEHFSVKLGHGGFGSVYRGVLKDGTLIAVKQLEGIGQGKKEFRAEVSIIGSIHHIHLVRLKGFCAEGAHRLLAYEYMAKGSLDKWIFNRNEEGFLLDWETRFNIVLGTAKGLAYLHEDCDVKIIHCDIKPENVLLDDSYQAKVSDFGLAKLMNREQSHVFTTLRGTRGYLAPEWITNYAISEKSDVYSFGMVLLEIIGGRKNFDPAESSEKSHFPTFAFKMAEERKLNEILDPKLKINDEDVRVQTAIKVALWCIQEDMTLRPSMSKVVQMLEGLCFVAQPPSSNQMGSRLHSIFLKSFSWEGTTSSGPYSDCNSDVFQSAVQLSGPR